MKSRGIILAIGLLIGGIGGFLLARQQARSAVLAGPYSDDYSPALKAIATAQSKLQSGDTNIMEELREAQLHIEHAQRWSRRFLGQPDGPTNANVPTDSTTN